MLTREQVLHIAGLAALDLSVEEITALQQDLSNIVQTVDKLQELDLAAFPFAPLQRPIYWREDAPGESLAQSEAVKNAPAMEIGFFAVPKTVNKD